MYRGENKQQIRSNIYKYARIAIIYTVLILLAFMCCFILYVVLIGSTRSHNSLVKGFSAIPGGSAGFNYRFVFQMEPLRNEYNQIIFRSPRELSLANIGRAFFNSFIIALSSSVLACYFSTMTAYGIHMYRFKLRNVAFTFILVIMMIPTQVSTLGLYVLLNRLKLTNNFLPLILPAIASPVTFFYIKQYMESVLPYEMIEAARVDGAGEIRIFHQIVLPVIKPALAIQFIFSFVGSWNNYFFPNLILDRSEMKTVPMVIAAVNASDLSKHLGSLNALRVLAIVPLVVVYLCFSRFIIKGLTLGSVKG